MKQAHKKASVENKIVKKVDIPKSDDCNLGQEGEALPHIRRKIIKLKSTPIKNNLFFQLHRDDNNLSNSISMIVKNSFVESSKNLSMIDDFMVGFIFI